MKKKLFLFAFIFLLAGVLANSQINITYFYSESCVHCANVAESGVLEKAAQMENVALQKYSVTSSPDLYNSFREKLDIPAGWPLAVIEKNGNFYYLQGDEPIIDNLEKSIINFPENQTSDISWKDKISSYLEKKFAENLNQETGRLTFLGWLILVVSSVIDSINPCAIGVLIFLMVALLKMGSSKRALRSGLVYTFVVFIVYFLAGFSIFKIIEQFTAVTKIIYLIAGILVLILGLWQFKDIIFPNLGAKLQISPSAKPLIEKIIQRGTLPAMILLGIIVSIFELPCTGGVYIAILTILSKFKVTPVLYLFVYNLIFILPLVVITFLIYKGTSPEALQKWTGKERKWMKVSAGIVLIILGIYILFFA